MSTLTVAVWSVAGLLDVAALCIVASVAINMLRLGHTWWK